jgi:hypothetical protein
MTRLCYRGGRLRVVRTNVFEAMPHGGFGGAPEDLEMRGEVRRFIDRIRSLN